MIKNKGQEEIVGFIVIVVLIVVVGLIFLIISSSGNREYKQESGEILAFLKSTSEYTSDCAIGYEPNYRKVGELIKDCNDGERCVSGESSCTVLNNTLSKIIDNSWNIGPEAAIKGYIFNATYNSNVSSQESKSENILLLSKGNCTSGIARESNDFYASGRGLITYGLQLCY